MNNNGREIPRWWAAYFLLVPLGLPLSSGLVIGDLPAFVLILFSLAGILAGESRSFGKTEGWFTFLVGCSLLGTEVTRVPEFYLKELSSVLFLFICLKITADFLSSEEKLARATLFTANATTTLLIINCIALLSHYTLGSELTRPFFSGGEKLSWPFEFSGQLGISLTILFPLALCTRRMSEAARLLLYAVMILNAGAIASRSVFWLSIFQILYIEFLIYTEKSYARNAFKLLLLLCAVGTLLMLFGENYSFQRSLGQIEKSPLLFDEPRIATLREALRTLPNWLQGYGLGCFKAFHKLEIHNTPLTLLVETGFAGFFAATAFIVSIFITFWRSRLRFSLIWHGQMLSFLAVLTNSMFRNLVTSRVSWFILALCLSHRHFRQQTTDAPECGKPATEQ
jgi:hypothetical protein